MLHFGLLQRALPPLFLKMAVVIIKIMLITFANTTIINNPITTRVSMCLLRYDNYANMNVHFVYPVNSQINLYHTGH